MTEWLLNAIKAIKTLAPGATKVHVWTALVPGPGLLE